MTVANYIIGSDMHVFPVIQSLIVICMYRIFMTLKELPTAQSHLRTQLCIKDTCARIEEVSVINL